MSKRTVRKLRHRDDLQKFVDAIGRAAIREEQERRHEQHCARAKVDAVGAARHRAASRPADVLVEVRYRIPGRSTILHHLSPRQVRDRRHSAMSGWS